MKPNRNFWRWSFVLTASSRLAGILALLLLPGMRSTAQNSADIAYQKPPKEILDLVDVDLPPLTIVDPANRFLIMLRRPTFKSLQELAQPELRLAGLRINPKSYDSARPSYTLGISIQELSSHRPIAVVGLPHPLRIEYAAFSPKGKYLGLINAQPEGLSLWVVDLASGKAVRVTDAILSASLGFPYLWSSDEASLYCRMRANSNALPEADELPAGPVIQESTGRKTPSRTYPDLLKNSADEARFEQFARTEVRRFRLDGSSEEVLPPGIFKDLQLSPDGNWLLVEEINPPYSYLLPYTRFPYRAYVTDRAGKIVTELVKKPLLDSIPINFDSTEPGRRDFNWRDDVPATIVFAEAQDGGDPAKDVPVRDRVFQWPAPFAGPPQLLCATTNRFTGVIWGDAGLAVVSDYWWKNRNTKLYRIDPSIENASPKVIYDYSSEDLYGLPGEFVTSPNRFGRDTLLFSHDHRRVFLTGEGYSPQGNRPFFDALDLASGTPDRIWRADGISTYESILRVLDAEKTKLLTRVESPNQYPNLVIRDLAGQAAPVPVTDFPSPYQSFADVKKEKIRYKRADGADLSADLYLRKGYDAARDGRLPLLMEAYPTEFKDPKAAGMVRTSPHQFVSLYWGSPVFWVMRGYAVLESAQFPIVGQGKEEPNDTYTEQLVGDAAAAIKAVDDMGIVDPKRVGVMGHSYGAFMVANLLAHCDLLAAGIARSGAYNRSLTPFGFQAEERTYWEAQPVYLKMSPFNYADKIKAPLLLIHGLADNNPGTFTIQSERLFQAVQGLGGKTRLVLLPFESHGYQARENILHMLWEEDSWLEKYVKNAAR
jgi:dipeptidyl aminopeptidase/acylaminoacyl peptidase